MSVTIRKVRAICTAPANKNLIVVKVETSEPGLTGIGCATFAYRRKAVAEYVDSYLSPLLEGRDVTRIEDLWSLMNVNAYWRNGPIANNAISGVDIALWDILGKLAGMPVYQLLGGKCREAVKVYRHANGTTVEHLLEKIHALMEEGTTHIRCHLGGYGSKQLVGDAPPNTIPNGFAHDEYYDPRKYVRTIVKMFELLRSKLGYDLELLHDIHERIAPIEAVGMAKELERFNLYFLEDAFAPEMCDWYKTLRSQCATPLAQGELFNNPTEWKYLITNRLIDFIRVHISQIGGITPAKKLAVLCEQFGVRTAWHGPGDVSPVGHAANVHLDMCSPNFGIQEWTVISEQLAEVFPGSPELRHGYVYLNDKPGLGIDINEKLAAKYPCDDSVTTWTQTRYMDGSLLLP